MLHKSMTDPVSMTTVDSPLDLAEPELDSTGTSTTTAINDWVTTKLTEVTVDDTTFYDLSGPLA